MVMQICPNLQYAFEILGKRWNGLIIHYLSLRPGGSAHFSDMKRELPAITPRALSLKLTELAEYGLLVKKVTSETPVAITYELTTMGQALTEALVPVQQWAMQYNNN